MATAGYVSVRTRWRWRVRADDDIGGDLLAVALVIADEAHADGTHALMSHQQLAAEVRVSERTAKRHTMRLRDRGYLQLSERGHRRGDGTTAANVYALTLPAPQSDKFVTPREPAQSDELVTLTGDSQSDSGEIAHAQNGASKGHSYGTPIGDEVPPRAPAHARKGGRRAPCTICGKPESACITASSKGPDPHAYAPSRAEPVKVDEQCTDCGELYSARGLTPRCKKRHHPQRVTA